MLYCYPLLARCVVFLFITMASSVFAETHVVMDISQSYGGEALATPTGRSLQLGAGNRIAWGMTNYELDSNFSYEATIGYKLNVVNLTQGSALFQTYPLTSVVYYNLRPFQYGVGVVLHLKPKYEYRCTDRTLCGESITRYFDTAAGLVFNYNYYFTKKSYFGLRYQMLHYNGVAIYDVTTGSRSDSIDVSNIAIQTGFEF